MESKEALSYVLAFPSAIRSLPHIEIALRFVLYWNQKNYIRVIRMISRLTFFQVCAIHPHMERVRRKILAIISIAYNKTTLPFEFLREVLKTNNEDEVEEMCIFYGIETKNEVASISKSNFHPENKIYPTSRSYLVERKLVGSNIESLILGEVNTY